MRANSPCSVSTRQSCNAAPRASLVGASARAGAVLLIVLGAGACAPKQKIRLDCVPKEVTVYVDRNPLADVPDSIELRADQSHVLFFKGGGYQPAMVVLDSEQGADGPALSPTDVCVELNLIERSRELQIEIER
jgi:hypothetical protein